MYLMRMHSVWSIPGTRKRYQPQQSWIREENTQRFTQKQCLKKSSCAWKWVNWLAAKLVSNSTSQKQTIFDQVNKTKKGIHGKLPTLSVEVEKNLADWVILCGHAKSKKKLSTQLLVWPVCPMMKQNNSRMTNRQRLGSLGSKKDIQPFQNESHKS